VTSFLLADESFPRSVLSCGEHVTTYLAELPRSELPAAVCARLAEVAASSRDLDLGGLKALTDDLGAILGELHNTVEHTYFLAPESRGTVSGSTAASRESPAPFGLPPGEEPDAGGSLTGSAERRYRVVHRTTYSYEDEAVQSYNETHLRPRRTERQICVAHRLDVEPEPEPDGWSEYLDAFGNPVATFVVRGGFRKLEVIATSDVTVIDPPAINSTLPWESVRLLLEVDRQPAGREARRLRHGTRLVPISADLADYAAPSFAPGRPLVEAAIDLCHRIYEDFVYEPGFTSVTTPVHEVLDHRRGVCQDFGHVMTGCIRSLGLAARYVSGYVETFPPPGREHVVGADASHAWASVYVPGWGWMDLDPTNDQLVGSRYVTVAWGGDYGDVSPLRGSVEGGGRTHQLEVAVDVIPLEADVDSG
jgi:transglutaminase-like putative cysteine protease